MKTRPSPTNHPSTHPCTLQPFWHNRMDAGIDCIPLQRRHCNDLGYVAGTVAVKHPSYLKNTIKAVNASPCLRTATATPAFFVGYYAKDITRSWPKHVFGCSKLICLYISFYLSIYLSMLMQFPPPPVVPPQKTSSPTHFSLA